MQISSRTHDYIVDTLSLREELWKLNKVTTNSKIVKIFHGGQADILWLQKDFGVYIVNMFDTFYASQKLCLPKENGFGKFDHTTFDGIFDQWPDMFNSPKNCAKSKNDSKNKLIL